MKIPKLTGPLTKSIRTLEGWLLVGTNVVIAVASAVEPDKLPPKEAAIVAGAVTAAGVISRSLLKGVALLKGVGVNAEPIAPAPSAQDIATHVQEGLARTLPSLLTQVAQDASKGTGAGQVVEQLVSDAEEFEHQPLATAAPDPAAPTTDVPEGARVIERPESARTPDVPPAPSPAPTVAPAPPAA